MEKKVTRRIMKLEEDTLTIVKVKEVHDVAHVKGHEIDELISSEETRREIKLTPVSRMELVKLRRTGKPGLVVKQGDKLSYAQVERKFTLPPMRHLCGSTRGCNNLYPSKCLKVRNRARNIENFDFLEGIEVFNTNLESFTVLKCKNYEDFKPRAERSLKEKIVAREAIELYLYS